MTKGGISNMNPKVCVVGLGYVGLSNAVILAQHNEVIGVDISQERVDALNTLRSPISDPELSLYLAEKELKLSASTDLKASVKTADYVIISTPTNYDEKTNFFDTSSVEAGEKNSTLSTNSSLTAMLITKDEFVFSMSPN